MSDVVDSPERICASRVTATDMCVLSIRFHRGRALLCLHTCGVLHDSWNCPGHQGNHWEHGFCFGDASDSREPPFVAVPNSKSADAGFTDNYWTVSFVRIFKCVRRSCISPGLLCIPNQSSPECTGHPGHSMCKRRSVSNGIASLPARVIEAATQLLWINVRHPCHSLDSGVSGQIQGVWVRSD